MFKKINGTPILNVQQYIKLTKNNLPPNTKIYIGTDSQIQSGVCEYVTVILIHNKKVGGHVIYKKEIGDIVPIYKRLWNEIEYSIETANKLADYEKEITIDLDINSNPKNKSSSLCNSGVAYVKSFGYNVRIKPDAFAASNCADNILH